MTKFTENGSKSSHLPASTILRVFFAKSSVMEPNMVAVSVVAFVHTETYSYYLNPILNGLAHNVVLKRWLPGPGYECES